MASAKIFFLLAMVSTLAKSSPLENFYYYPLLPYFASVQLGRGWEICADTSTIIQQRYKEVYKRAEDCYGEFSQSNQSICHSFELNVQRCSQPLVDFFVDCLPEKSKGLPPAALKAAASVVETFCASSGEILLEAANKCIYEYIYQQRNRKIRAECKKELLQPKVDKFTHELPSISEVCEVGREIGDCWQEYVNQDCDSLKSREFFSKFYNAALSACSKK